MGYNKIFFILFKIIRKSNDFWRSILIPNNYAVLGLIVTLLPKQLSFFKTK